jgi:hypothetical protein
MTDFRALCAELTEKLQEHTSLYEGHESELVARARAALAEQPVAPTDEELCETYRTAYYAEKNRQGPHCMAAGLRAVVARWGQS